MSDAFIHIKPQNPSPIIILCDHASNHVPDWVSGGDLGVDEADMNRHIAYDVGALGVSKLMAQALDGHLIASQFSRLVIDPNRGLDDPTLIMKVYDKTMIPANRNMRDDERIQRIERLHKPYHRKIAEVISDIRESKKEPIIIAMHSFTKQLRGRAERPWHIGILSAEDRRLAELLIKEFSAIDGICVGDNEPYHGALEGDTLDQHGIRQGIVHGLIEVRNDLIEDESGQAKWAQICVDVVKSCLIQGGHL